MLAVRRLPLARPSRPARARAQPASPKRASTARPCAAAGAEGVPAARRTSPRSTSSTARPRSPGCPSAARSATSSSSRRAARSARARSSGRTRTTSSSEDDDHDDRGRRRPRPPSRLGGREAGEALRESASRRRCRSTSRCPGSPARPTRSTPTSARSRRAAPRRGASLTASTFAGRASRVTSTARIPGSSAGRRSRARRPIRCGSYGAKRTFMTTTNVADARDLYTFHRTNLFFTGTISVPRPRAARSSTVRSSPGCLRRRGAHGAPSTATFSRRSRSGRSSTLAAVSDVQSDAATVGPHALTPGFVFGGDSGGAMDYNGGAPAELFRVYIATDEDCVNIVYRGAIVGSPAYAPRTTGPLQLPTDTARDRDGTSERRSTTAQRADRAHGRRHRSR